MSDFEAFADSSEDGWTDETEDDSDRDSILSVMMHDFEEDYMEFDKETDEESTHEENYEAEVMKRDLGILRTNRQTYSEASELFYSEAILTLEPGDVFCLAKNPHDLEFGHANEKMVWKHNPLKGVGQKTKAGVVRYDSEPLSGDIEPHVLAKFHRIFFDAHFDAKDTGAMELWIDDNTHVISEEDATRFKDLLNSSTIFKHLGKILSNSPLITHLDIRLEVEVIAVSNLIMEDENLADMVEDPSDDEEDEEREKKVDRIMEIANFKATELFLDSKAMKPLLKLKNVANCTFKFGFGHLDEAEAYKPPTKYVEILKRLKNKIENNFKAPVDEA